MAQTIRVAQHVPGWLIGEALSMEGMSGYFKESLTEDNNEYYVCLFDSGSRHFQQYFSYIVAVSFIGGGNQRTRGKPPTYHKSLTNFIT